MATAWILATLIAGTAHAADRPVIRVQDDGTVVGRLRVEAPAPEVRQAISENLSDARGLTNVLDVRATPDGNCHKVERRTRGLVTPLEMRTRFCPTPKGWREFLVQSDSYTAYNVEWTVEPTAEGSEILLEVHSDVNLYVPTSLITAGTVQGMNESFAALLKRILAGRGAR